MNEFSGRRSRCEVFRAQLVNIEEEIGGEDEDLIYDGDFLIKNSILSAKANISLSNVEQKRNLFNVTRPNSYGGERPAEVEQDKLTFSIVDASKEIGMEKYLVISDYKKNSIQKYLPKTSGITYLNKISGTWKSERKRSAGVVTPGGGAGSYKGGMDSGEMTQEANYDDEEPMAVDIIKPIAEYVDTENIITDVIFYPNENRKMYYKYLIHVLRGDGTLEEEMSEDQNKRLAVEMSSRTLARADRQVALPQGSPQSGDRANQPWLAYPSRPYGLGGGSKNIGKNKLNNKKTKRNKRIKKNTKRNKKDKRNKSKKNKTRRKKVKGKKKTIKRV